MYSCSWLIAVMPLRVSMYSSCFALQWVAPTPDSIGYLQSIFRTSPSLQPSHIDGDNVVITLQHACSYSKAYSVHCQGLLPIMLLFRAEGMRVLRQLQSRLDVFQGADADARLVSGTTMGGLYPCGTPQDIQQANEAAAVAAAQAMLSIPRRPCVNGAHSKGEWGRMRPPMRISLRCCQARPA